MNHSPPNNHVYICMETFHLPLFYFSILSFSWIWCLFPWHIDKHVSRFIFIITFDISVWISLYLSTQHVSPSLPVSSSYNGAVCVIVWCVIFSSATHKDSWFCLYILIIYFQASHLPLSPTILFPPPWLSLLCLKQESKVFSASADHIQSMKKYNSQKKVQHGHVVSCTWSAFQCLYVKRQ